MANRGGRRAAGNAADPPYGSGSADASALARSARRAVIPGTALFRTRLGKHERARIVEAIRRAEAGNRGEVRVHIEGRSPRGQSPIDRAAALFEALGMRATAQDTGVLLYVAEGDRRAAVYAGAGVYGAHSPSFWQGVIDRLVSHYREGDRVGGIEAALAEVGVLLCEAAPGEDLAGDELPNEVSLG